MAHDRVLIHAHFHAPMPPCLASGRVEMGLLLSFRDPNKVFELSQMEELREAMNDHRPKGEGRSRSRDEDVFGVGNRKSERKSADAWLRFKKSRDKVCLRV